MIQKAQIVTIKRGWFPKKEEPKQLEKPKEETKSMWYQSRT